MNKLSASTRYLLGLGAVGLLWPALPVTDTGPAHSTRRVRS